MKKLFCNYAIVGLFVFNIIGIVPAFGINVEGDVWGAWETSNNPYNVIGELRVPPGSTLAINPGCVIIFQGHFKFVVDSNAVLNATGTEIDSIIFTARDTLSGWHGIRFYYSDSSSILDHCILEYGNAVGYGFEEFGGAIFIYHSPISIVNCRISSSKARSGGGIYCYYSDAVIENNSICGNYVERFGGGLKIRDCSPLITYNLIYNNRTSYSGGGIEISFSNSTIMNNHIFSNKARYGGGSFFRDCATIFISNTITDNYSILGGGLYIYNSTPILGTTLDPCNIYDNSAGIGMDLYIESSPLINVYIDTFTVLIPDNYFAFPISNYNLNINTGYFDPIASDIYVSPHGDNSNDGLTPLTPLRNIGNALIKIAASSNNPRIINLLPGTYSRDSNGERFPLNAKSNVLINGDNSDSTFLNGGTTDSPIIYCFHDTGASLSNLILTDCANDSGGCLFATDSRISLNNIEISNSYSSYGGAIYSQNSQLTVTECEFFSNGSIFDGGAIYCTENYNTDIEYNYFYWDTAAGSGGAIYLENGEYILNNNTFTNSAAYGSGGAAYCGNSIITLDSNVVSDNYADASGGGIYLINCPSTIFSNNTINNNLCTEYGGGVFADSCRNSSISDNAFINNGSDGSYGGIFWRGDSSAIVGNLIKNNTASGSGGGIGIDIAGAVFSGNVIRANQAGDSGGGLSLGNEFDCVIGPNIIKENSAFQGGGICVLNANVVFQGTSISSNRAFRGGGIYSDFRSNIAFGTAEYPCNIYLNNSQLGMDIYFQIHPDSSNLVLYADTFTVQQPDNYLIHNIQHFDLNINYGYYELIDADIYVSPNGNNFNDGLTPQTALRTIDVALTRANTNQLFNINVHLLPGLYSASTNGELFPINAKTNVEIIGSENGECILDAEIDTTIVYAYYDSNFAFRNIKFINGKRAFFIVYSRNVSIEDNIFEDNSADGEVGGAILIGNSLIEIARNVFHNNCGISAVSFHGTTCVIQNNTFYGNYCNSTGASLYLTASNILGKNNIFWHNTPGINNDEILFNSYGGGIYEFVFNDIEGGFEGEGNIDIDPLFMDPVTGDFNLRAQSPCIDAGDPLSPLDPDSTVADMGAFFFDQQTGLAWDQHTIPIAFALWQNYPNPFNDMTMIKYSISRSEFITLKIYDVLGRLVAIPIAGVIEPGIHNLRWDCRDATNNTVSSGIYFYELASGTKRIRKKMILLK